MNKVEKINDLNERIGNLQRALCKMKTRGSSEDRILLFEQNILLFSAELESMLSKSVTQNSVRQVRDSVRSKPLSKIVRQIR